MLMEAEREVSYDLVEDVNLSTFKPMPHHLVVRWLKKVESKGGVLYPENRQRKNYMKGEILVSGECDNTDLKEGVTIQFESLCDKQFLGVQDPADRDPVFIMREEDVHGVLIPSFTNNKMQMIFEPMNEYVLLKPDEGKKEFGKLIVPESIGKAGEKVWSGVVISVGPKVKSEPKYRDLGVLPAHRVAYDAFTASEVILNEDKHVLLRVEYIMGEVDESADLDLVGA